MAMCHEGGSGVASGGRRARRGWGGGCEVGRSSETKSIRGTTSTLSMCGRGGSRAFLCDEVDGEEAPERDVQSSDEYGLE